MKAKSFIIILVLSVIVTYGVAFIDFSVNITKGSIGLPFGFSYFNFLGAETDMPILLLDIAFWFLVIWGIWKLLLKSKKKKNVYLPAKNIKEAVQERRDSAHKG